jgi:hypothetical protein
LSTKPERKTGALGRVVRVRAPAGQADVSADEAERMWLSVY